MRKVFGILLIALGLLVLAGVVARIFPFPTHEVNKTIELDNTKNINVSMTSDNVKIVPEHRKDIKVILKKKRFQNIQITAKNGPKGINIGVKDKGWFWLFNGGATIEIRVPAEYEEGISVKMDSGNFFFDGSTMDLKRLAVEIKSGNTSVNHIHVDRLLGDLYSGNLRMNHVVAVNQADIKVRSGNVSINYFKGPLSVDSSSGNIGVQFDALVKDVTVNTKSGNVNLNLPNDAGFRIKAQLKSGNIHNNLSLRDSMGDNNYLIGTHGNGKSLIKINGWSGNVKIY